MKRSHRPYMYSDGENGVIAEELWPLDTNNHRCSIHPNFTFVHLPNREYVSFMR